MQLTSKHSNLRLGQPEASFVFEARFDIPLPAELPYDRAANPAHQDLFDYFNDVWQPGDGASQTFFMSPDAFPSASVDRAEPLVTPFYVLAKMREAFAAWKSAKAERAKCALIAEERDCWPEDGIGDAGVAWAVVSAV